MSKNNEVSVLSDKEKLEKISTLYPDIKDKKLLTEILNKYEDYGISLSIPGLFWVMGGKVLAYVKLYDILCGRTHVSNGLTFFISSITYEYGPLVERTFRGQKVQVHEYVDAIIKRVFIIQDKVIEGTFSGRARYDEYVKATNDVWKNATAMMEKCSRGKCARIVSAEVFKDMTVEEMGADQRDMKDVSPAPRAVAAAPAPVQENAVPVHIRQVLSDYNGPGSEGPVIDDEVPDFTKPEPKPEEFKFTLDDVEYPLPEVLNLVKSKMDKAMTDVEACPSHNTFAIWSNVNGEEINRWKRATKLDKELFEEAKNLWMNFEQDFAFKQQNLLSSHVA